MVRNGDAAPVEGYVLFSARQQLSLQEMFGLGQSIKICFTQTW